MKVHLDTDFGGDPDDACALAMLLGWPDVEVVGITTNLDAHGGRAGCVEYCLALTGRTSIPVVAGAKGSMTTGEQFDSTASDARYWPEPISPRPSPPPVAGDLLEKSIRDGATVIATGALTNLALLEKVRRGALEGAPVVAMGGWVNPPEEGLPQWGPEMDFNIQCDTTAARIVADVADLTLVTMPVAMKAQLREEHLHRLRDAGSLGGLLARQSMVYAKEQGMSKLGKDHPGLADDLVNFHWDPVTAAVAVGWTGAEVEEQMLSPVVGADEILRWQQPDEKGRLTGVVRNVDSDNFTETWLNAVEAACSS